MNDRNFGGFFKATEVLVRVGISGLLNSSKLVGASGSFPVDVFIDFLESMIDEIY